MLRTHRAGKGPGGCGGWGLGSRNRRGPGMPPPLVLEGRGPHLGAPQASWARIGGQTPSSPLLLLPSGVWEGPSRLPLLISPASLLCQLPWWSLLNSQADALPSKHPTRVSNRLLLSLSSQSPSRLPLLIFPASGAQILSGFHFSSPLSPPTSYRFTLGFFPSPCVSESPTSGQQVP